MAPFTGLGVRLREAGHQVAVATHAGFAESVRAAGLEFRPLPVDPRTELASARGQRLLQAGPGPLALLELLRLGRAFMPALGDGIADAAERGADVLLTTSTTTALGQVAAEAAGIPCLGLYLQPLAPTREFAPAVTGTRSLGRTGNLLAGRAVQGVTDRLFAPAVRRLRRRLGLPQRSIGRLRRHQPLLHGFSPLVVPRPADWHPDHTVTGYWWPRREPGWQPPSRLAEFLAAGPPPVFVGFGSLVVPDPQRLTVTVLASRAPTPLPRACGRRNTSMPQDERTSRPSQNRRTGIDAYWPSTSVPSRAIQMAGPAGSRSGFSVYCQCQRRRLPSVRS